MYTLHYVYSFIACITKRYPKEARLSMFSTIYLSLVLKCFLILLGATLAARSSGGSFKQRWKHKKKRKTQMSSYVSKTEQRPKRCRWWQDRCSAPLHIDKSDAVPQFAQPSRQDAPIRKRRGGK